ncbi:type IV secretion system protein TraC [Thorsellia kenyensis]|uniref:Type IV secretion system protein TraC n=1 Tax=Thorsellia kenyensis TaxID=1549888 RepID=A0ABV6CD83_9GAMM
MKIIKNKQHRLADKLSVLAYESDAKIFFLDDGHLGFGFICEPLPYPQEHIASRLNVLMNFDWPKDSLLQMSLIANPNIYKALIEFKSLRILKKIPSCVVPMRKKVEFFETNTQRKKNQGFLPAIRDFMLVITCKIPLESAFPTQEKIDSLKPLQQSVVQSLKTIGFHFEIMNSQGYVSIMSDLINLNQSVKQPQSLDIDKTLNQQILHWDCALHINHNVINLSEKVIKTLSFKRLPSRFYFGHAAHYAADKMTGDRGLGGHFYITATIHFPDLENQLSRLETKRQWSINQAYGPMVKFVPMLGEKKRGFDILFEAIAKGDRPVKFMLTLILISDSLEDSIADVSNAKTFYKELGFEIMEDKYFHFPIWLNSLPFGADRRAINDLFRYKTLASSQAAALLPIFSDWKGTGTPVLELISRTGQLMPISLFDSTSNYNCCIAAQSGAGKSFLVNELIASYLSIGGQCWVIDVGRSYEKLCEFYQGDFLAFGQTHQMNFNPFAQVQNYAEESDMLVTLISSMAAPQSALSDLQIAELKRAMHTLFEEQNTQMTIDDLAILLKKHQDKRVVDIGIQLYPFTSQGEYGRFFHAKNTTKLNGQLTVLELEELKGRKNLQQVILLSLIYQIQQEMYLGDRDKPKILFIDEAWDLLSEGDIAKFIETGYRRFRKYGGAAVTITQSINDLYQHPTGKAIAENSANMFLLGQKAETIDQLKLSNRLPLNSSGYELLKTLHTIPGKYAEIFLITPSGIGIGRLIVDDFHRLLYSTKAEDVHAIKQLTDEGLNTNEAILSLLEKR